MAETYMTLSSLKHYDEKIKEVISKKQDQLVGTEGQVVSFDENGNVISIDLDVTDLGEKLDKENPTGSGSLSLNRLENSTVGEKSVAVGNNTTASGLSSNAEGNDTVASGESSHAEGGYTTASGYNSHSEGSSTTASGDYAHAEGKITIAEGYASHAEGDYSTATGYAAHAEGNTTTASGNYSHSEGGYTIANGQYQHVQGKFNIPDTENQYAHIVGGGKSSERKNIHTLDWDGNAEYTGDVTATKEDGTKVSLIDVAENASELDKKLDKENPNGTGSLSLNRKDSTDVGNYSVAVGDRTTATGKAAFAEGCLTSATAPQSHAEGDGTVASGTGAHAEGGYVDGVYTTASGDYSHAEGVGTTASEAGTHTEGYKTTATAPYAHAEGYEANATGGVSHAEGYKTTAAGLRSHAEGVNSKTGSSATAAHAEGWSTQALGAGSHSEGIETIAEGIYSHAEGGNNTAKGKYQHVEGLYNDKIKQILVPGIKWTSCSANLVVSISNMYNSLGVSTNHSDANYTYDNVSYKYKVRCDASKFDNISNLTGSTSNHYRGYIYFASTDSNDIYDNILLVREDGSVTIYYNNNEIYNQRTWFGTTVYPSCDIGISEADTGTGVDSYTTPDLTATHVQGKYSYVDNSYAHIVGGGTSDSDRKNIHTLDWSGNAEYLGDVKATTKDNKKISLLEVSNKASEVDSVKSRVKTIEDDYLKSSDKTALTTAIATAKQEAIETILGEGVDADFDTLKEVADWIQSDTTASAQLVTRVTNAEKDIDDLQSSITNKVDKVSGKGLSTNDLTSTLKSNYDKAYTHSQAAHAPSNAEKNQNAFSYVLADGNIVSATSTTDSLYLTGENVTISNAIGERPEVIIKMTKDNVVSALGYTPSNDAPMGTCSTAKNDSTKVVSATGYTEAENAIITVRFINDVGANASIKVNDGVEHPIRHIGGLIKDGVICAENLATFKHVGDYYYLIAVNDSTSTCMKKENPSGTGTFSMNSSTASGTYSAAIGVGTVASGQAAFSQGYSTQAKGVCSVATGYENIAFGNYSLVEGSYNNKVESFANIDELSIACSCDSVNSTSLLHDGIEYTKSARVYVTSNINPSKTSTTGYYKGRMVNTSNSYVVSDLLIYYPGSSIEVYSTSNSLMNFAGINTLTLYFEKAEIPPSTDSTHIQGKYSLIDGDYAHVVGNGTSDSDRSNAHTLDWKGNATFAGDVKATDAVGNTVSLLDVASKSNDGGTLPPYYVGTCSTSAGTSSKTVSITNFELKVGVEVHVKFTYTNTSSSATLNVSSTGAKAMYYKNGDRMYYIPADIYHTFVYDGTYWRYLGSENALISTRSSERYGFKLSGSALVPIISGYSPSLGTTGSKIGTLYANNIGSDSYPTNYIYGDTINANELYTKTGNYRTKVLPPFPLLYGNFTVSSYQTITFYSDVYQKYMKTLNTPYLNYPSDVVSCGCAYAGSAQGNTYDIALLFRVIGYDSSSSKKAVPFVHEFALTTAYTTYDCGDNSSDWYVFNTPCGNSVYFYLTGISIDSCGYVSGTPVLNISGTTSNVHFSEIALIP